MSQPGWNGYEFKDQYSEFTNHLEDIGFDYIGEGSFRSVYARGKVVIKVPINTDGLNDNRVEHLAYRRLFSKPSQDGIRCAPCRLLPNGCLMMVRMEPIDIVYPTWAKKVDGRQVGAYKGTVVAYDYALDLVERFEWEKQFKERSQFFHSESWEGQRTHIRKFKQSPKFKKVG